MISTAVALDQVLAENEAHLHHNKPALVGILVMLQANVFQWMIVK